MAGWSKEGTLTAKLLLKERYICEGGREEERERGREREREKRR